MRSAGIILLALSLFLSGVSSSCIAERPNIVWIVADDLGPELACYGTPAVATPRIDQLAAEGRRYTNVFATSPVCSSSRSAFVTGMYQTAISAHHHRTRLKVALPDGVKTVMESLHDAGYYTCNNGGPDGCRRGKTDFNFASGSDYDRFDGIDWKARKPGQPFFAQVQLHEPHREFVKNEDAERTQKLQLPPVYPDHPVTRADYANYLATIEVLDRRVGAVLDRLDREGVLDNTVVFFFGDHGQPHVWGKQWLYDAGLRVPLIVRWPERIPAAEVDTGLWSMLDITAATYSAAGLAVPDWLHGRDCLLGNDQPRDAVFAARDRCGDADDRIRAVRTQRYKYIRNDFPERPYTQVSGYKLLQYPALTLMQVMHDRGELTAAHDRFFAEMRPAEELYDLDSDPHELVNLAEEPEQQTTLGELRQRLADWAKQYPDRGLQTEGENEPGGREAYLERLMKEKRAYFERTMKRRGLDPGISNEDYLRWWEQQLGVK